MPHHGGSLSFVVCLQELLPLVFMVELPVTSILVATLDASSPTIQYIQSTYSVTVTCKQRPRVFSTTTVMVRGSVSNAKAVKEATVRLIEHLTGNRGVSYQREGGQGTAEERLTIYWSSFQ